MVGSQKNNRISIVFIILINTTERRTHPPEKMRGGIDDCNVQHYKLVEECKRRNGNHSNRGVDAFVVSRLRKFLPSSLVLVLPDARNSFENSSRKRTHFFSTNAAGRNNKEQGRGKEEGKEEQQQEEDDDDDEEQETIQTTTMPRLGCWLRHARQGGRGGEGRERIQQQHFYKVVVEEQYHLRHLRDGNQEYEKI